MVTKHVFENDKEHLWVHNIPLPLAIYIVFMLENEGSMGRGMEPEKRA